jgi:hypothetical protein
MIRRARNRWIQQFGILFKQAGKESEGGRKRFKQVEWAVDNIIIRQREERLHGHQLDLKRNAVFGSGSLGRTRKASIPCLMVPGALSLPNSRHLAKSHAYRQSNYSTFLYIARASISCVCRFRMMHLLMVLDDMNLVSSVAIMRSLPRLQRCSRYPGGCCRKKQQKRVSKTFNQYYKWMTVKR